MPNISLYFVRHGQRIDQVDPSWTNTSPCPQDPPLTALGKQQARQTGKMIRDFAYESVASSPISTPATPPSWTLQRITPPLSPDRSSPQSSSSSAHQDCYYTSATAPSTLPPASASAPHGTTAVAVDSSHNFQQRRRSSAGSSSTRGRKHHFAIITSPFLRCSETAIELARGMRTGSATSTLAQAGQSTVQGGVNGVSGSHVSDTAAAMDREHDRKERDLVTIAVEAGLAEWLSLEYVSEPAPESIIVQRMQDFALARREHEQYYTIDWKYIAKDRCLPSWPETREDMQARLDRTLAHILQTYTGSITKDSDISIVFVTHASPVNALLEACLQTPILVPVPNCSISRCRWTPTTESSESIKNGAEIKDEESQRNTNSNNNKKDSSLIPDVLIQSRQTHTIAQEQGRWLLDYQTHTRHLDRDRR